MENIGGDSPFAGDFGGDLAAEDFFDERQTDKIMAFDIADVADITDGFAPANISSYGGNTVADSAVTTRKVALFEGLDEFGRLQPLLGAEVNGEFKAIPWHLPTTENPALGATEQWDIYNFTGDAHPVHLHLVNFEILGRKALAFDDSGEPQTVLQHNGALGTAPSISGAVVGGDVSLGTEDGYAENAPKDMVTALPEQVTSIKATFDKPGRYVWHCHILSHEVHVMMRVLHVVPGA
jgi:spore coat protein A